jgi:PAS domain S-box-containing protein
MRTRVPKKVLKAVPPAHPAGTLFIDDPANLEAEQRSIIEQLPQAMFVADPKGVITYCNQHWFELTGLTCDQTVEKGWTSSLHPEDRPRALANWRKLITTGVPTQAELRFRCADDGDSRWHLFQLLSLKNAGGSVLQQVGIATDIHAQKTTELELRKREDQLNLAIEAGRFGTWDFFLDGHRFSSSYRARAMFGRPPDVELAYEEFVGMLHDEDRITLRQAYNRALEPGGLSDFELSYRITRPDGAVRWIAARGKGVFSGVGSDRKPERLIGTVQDITDRKTAEEALRDSEEKFRTAFHSNPEAMSITTLAEGVYLAVNDAFLRVTGFTREDLMGRKSLHVRSWVEKEDRERLVQILKSKGRVESMETSFRKRNGEIFFVHLSAELIEIGKLQCVLATSQDVTAERRLVEELRLSEEQHRSLIDRAPYGICRISAQGRFLLVNPALARMLGYENSAELLELDLATQVYEDPAERARIISTLTQDMSKAPPIETRWKRKDGRTITVRLAGTPIRDGQGRLLHSEVFVERLAEQ